MNRFKIIQPYIHNVYNILLILVVGKVVHYLDKNIFIFILSR